MKIIVGLGNPGEKYARTRHNTGFLSLEALKKQVPGIKDQENMQWLEMKKFQVEICQINDWLLVKPQTFMNSSGKAVRRILKYYDIKIQKKPNTQHPTPNTLFVIHDDLDVPLGKYKIQFGKGPRQHGGLLSVEQHLKTKDFWRVRIGVKGKWYDNIKTSVDKTVAEDYLLKPFSQDERMILDRTLKEIGIELFKQILKPFGHTQGRRVQDDRGKKCRSATSR